MSIEIKVPQLPESVSSATVAAWTVEEGDTVDRDQNVLELETDKVMLDVPAAEGGVLKEIRIKAGESVKAGDVLGVIEAGAAKAPAKEAADDKPKASDAPAKAAAEKPESRAAVSDSSDHDGQLPAVRKRLSELGLKAADVNGTGRGGRITLEDIDAHQQKAKSAPAPAQQPARGSQREAQRVPMTRIRQRIAERLVEAQQTAAMLTTFNEVDLQAVMDLRSRHKGAFEKAHGVKLGFMSFFVKATIEALKKYPVVNASVDGTDVLYHDYFDIGIAVSGPRGLVVPVLRDADQMSFAEVELAIAEFGNKARDNKLSMDDLTGGTFSITNGGIFGSMMSTPILNPPQSAILGMHGITERPVVVDGQIVVRPMMYLALTYDHRIIDGREAVMTLRTIKEGLEDPAKLLLQL
jgi:2-oxoglutarate dehydrogenase E2 component (dihydrolipoamide succinyltransferase)